MKDIDYKLIDINKWEETLDQIKDKKIVIFGAGNNGKELLDMLPYKVSYFIDNDREKWNKKLNNISIKNPEVLKNEKENVSVLVVGYLYDDMISQLSKFNLGKNIHVYNVYSILENMLNELSFFNRGEDMINFYKRIPDNIIINNGLSKEKISVLVSNFSFSSSPFYLITIAVMLKVRGNDVEIIWDDLEGLDEIYYNHDNMTSTQNKIIDKILNYVNERFNIKIIKMSEMGLEYLDSDDIRELKELSKVNTISKYRKVFFDKECEEYEKKCFEVLKYNFKKIKYLFNNYKIEKIVSFTGLHKKTGLYTWGGNKYNILVFSYDVSDRGLIVATEGAVTHQIDILKIIKEKKLNNELLKKIIHFSEDHFYKRLMSINNKSLGIYQQEKYNEKVNNYKYDIVIPLNICWDGAALGINSFFNSFGDWLRETITYILDNTEATIAVRQHPGERFFNTGKDIKRQLERNFHNNSRVAYISCQDNINTYNLVKEAKVVLPYTSTVGIESVLLNKIVIMENNAYYSEMKFVQKAKSKEDYFFKIKDCLSYKSYKLSKQSIDEALLCYALVMFNYIETKFIDLNMNIWIKESFEDMIRREDVKKFLHTFETGEPIALNNIIKNFKYE